MADTKKQIAGLLTGQSQGGLLSDLWRQPQDMGMLSNSTAYYPVPQPEPAYSGAVLPFSRDVFGNTSFDSDAGLLGLAKRALTMPGDAMSGQLPMKDASGHTSLEAIGRATDLAGLMSLGATGAPRGALGSGAVLPKRNPLPMDEASRLARAKDMGFYTEMPLYHGTGGTFSQFKAVPTSADGWVTPGVSTARNPEIANEFAVRSAGSGQANPQVYKLLHRAESSATLTLSGREAHHEVVGALRDAFNGGHDAVMLRNYTSPDGKSGDIVIVRDANQLRSPAARFDPAKKYDLDLLSALEERSKIG